MIAPLPLCFSKGNGFRQKLVGMAGFEPATPDPSPLLVLGGSGGPDASIEIVGVTREGGSVVVRYREQRSPVDRMSRTAAIAPFHIVVVPAERMPVRFVVVTSPPDDLAGHARHDAVQRATPTTC